MKTQTHALTALADHLETVTKNVRSHAGHGWTYDEEIDLLRGAAQEIDLLRRANSDVRRIALERDAMRSALLSARGGLCSAAIKDGTLEMINNALGESASEPSNCGGEPCEPPSPPVGTPPNNP